MYKIKLENFDISDELETIEEVEQTLKEYIEEDINEESSFDIEKNKDNYEVYQDDEFLGYDSDFVDFEELKEKYSGDWEKSEKYYKMLDNNKFSEEMIKDVLYSVNKKAKNYRDEVRALSGNNQFKYQYDIAKSNKNQMYRYKEMIIEKFPIVEIHKNYTDNIIYLENEEFITKNITYLGLVDVYGYKVHTILDEEKLNGLVKNGIEIKETEFEIEGEANNRLLNDRVIDLFIEKWNEREKNTIEKNDISEELER